MKKISRKQIIIAGAVLLIGALALSTYLKAVAVEAVEVKRQAVAATVTEKGKVTAPASQEIFSEGTGKIIKIFAEEGDQIKAGNILAQLDTSDIDAQISQVEGEIKALQGGVLTSPGVGRSQVQQQQIAVEEARTALTQAQKEYNRTSNLYQEGAATQAEFDQAQNNMEIKKKALAQAEASLKVTQEQNQGTSLQYQGQKESLEAKRRSLQNQKQKNTIVSSSSGTVLNKEIKQGDYVTAGQKLFSVGDTKNLNIETYLITRDVYNVRKGDQVRVVLNTPGGKDIYTEGKIAKISPATVEKTSALGVVEEKVKVTVELIKVPQGINLFPGMEVDVDITTQKAEGVMAIPTEAIFSDKGENYVWLIQDGKAKTIQIETGIEGDVLTEIKEGLKEGAVIILNPHDPGLKENVRVTKI